MTTATMSAPAPTTSALMLPWVAQATRGFVHADEMREAISLALAGGLHIIFSGPGGHAKSQFVEVVGSAIGGLNPFIMSLHQETTVADLYGGPDIAALNRAENAALQYNVGASFLLHPLVVLEEGLDAPSRALSSLKNTMTAGALRNGLQVCPLATRLFIITTNHDPAVIAARGDYIQAFIERFAIHLKVKWSSYDFDAYYELLRTADGMPSPEGPLVEWSDIAAMQGCVGKVRVGPLTKRVLAAVSSELVSSGVTISPRTAMYALRMVRAAALIAGRDIAAPEDVEAMAFLPGCMIHRSRIKEMITDCADEYGPMSAAEALKEEVNELLAQTEGTEDEGALSELLAMARKGGHEANQLKGDVAMYGILAELRHEYQELCITIKDRIENLPSKVAALTEELDGLSGRLASAKESSKARDLATLEKTQGALDGLLADLHRCTTSKQFQDRLEQLKSDATTLSGQLLLKINTHPGRR